MSWAAFLLQPLNLSRGLGSGGESQQQGTEEHSASTQNVQPIIRAMYVPLMYRAHVDVLYGTAREESLHLLLKQNPFCSSCQMQERAKTVLGRISLFQGNSRRFYVAKVNGNSLAISRVSLLNPFRKRVVPAPSYCLALSLSKKPLQKQKCSGSRGCWEILLVSVLGTHCWGKRWHLDSFPYMPSLGKTKKRLRYFWNECSRYGQPVVSFNSEFWRGENYMASMEKIVLHYLGFCFIMDHSQSSENRRWAIIYEMIKCSYYIRGNKSLDGLIYLMKVRHAAQILIGSFWNTN